MELDTIRELLGNAGLILGVVLSTVFTWQMFKAWSRKDDLMAMIYFVAIWSMFNNIEIGLISKNLGV